MGEGRPVTLAVGEAVEPTAYPFPARPAELKPLLPPATDGATVIRSDPADPGRTREATWKWAGPGVLAIQSTTPGRLRVLVNGVDSAGLPWWDYEAHMVTTPFASGPNWSGPVPAVGEQVAVTVIPERITGEWSVELPVR